MGPSTLPARASYSFHIYDFDSFTKGLVDPFLPALLPYWRPSKPYTIVFPKNRDVRDALERARLNAKPEWQSDIVAIAASSFETRRVGAIRLSANLVEPVSGVDFAVQRWWVQNLRRSGHSAMTFVMLNRLTEILIRTRAPLKRQLQVNYPV